MDRRQRILDLIEPHGRRGIEIGPLTRPIVLPSDGEILYADHLPTEGLRAKYANDPNLGPAGLDGLAAIDLVLDGRPMAEVLGARDPVDYIVASHVVEHVADPIGWLSNCADALKDGGSLFLAVPDRRFTFDHLRGASTTGDLVALNLAKPPRPTPEQVFEHIARAVWFEPGEVIAAWEGDPISLRHMHDDALPAALAHARLVSATDVYLDVHCTTYTPASLLDVFREIIALDLIPFEVATIVPTLPYEVEFFVLLRKRARTAAAVRAAATPSVDRLMHGELPRPATWMPWRLRAARAIRRLRTRSLRNGLAKHR